jgi:hypothetical protein
MTVQEVYNLYLRYKKDLSDISDDLFFDWCDEVNRFAYRIMMSNTPDTITSVETINLVAGQSTYALPADFLNIQPLGTGFFRVFNGVVSDQMLFKTNYGSPQDGYYIDGTNVVFTPAPNGGGQVALRYVPKIDSIDSFADSLVVPDEFIYYVRDAIDAKYAVWDEDISAEGLADARFSRALDELARNLRKDASTVGIQTYTNAFFG